MSEKIGKPKRQSARLTVRRANSMGVEKMHMDKRSTTWVNTRTCPKCGAKPGQTCFTLSATTFRELKKTHTEHCVLSDEFREKKPAPLTEKELAARKRSQEILDRRHAAKKRREAESSKRKNGIHRPSDPMK
jgi:hypothetical protein